MANDTKRIRETVSLAHTIESFGYRLTRNGDEWETCCPFHAEDTPSFTVFDGKDGVSRFHCFGCDAKGDVLDFVKEVKACSLPEAIAILDGTESRPNIKPKQIKARDPYEGIKLIDPATLPPLRGGDRVRLYNPKRKGQRSEWGSFIPNAIYNYRNADGSLFGMVLRHNLSDGGKETPMVMAVELPDGTRTWCRFPFPKPRPLYGADQIKPETTQVTIVEGEKCRVAYQRAAKRVAVSWPGGVNGIQYVDLSPLARKNILIWPDHDKVGRAAAHALAILLIQNYGCSVRIGGITEDGEPMEGPYAFEDFTAGRFPAKGWDAADAVDDGWGKVELDAFMKATLTPVTLEAVSEEVEPEPETVAPAAEPVADNVAEIATQSTETPASELSDPAGTVAPDEPEAPATVEPRQEEPALPTASSEDGLAPVARREFDRPIGAAGVLNMPKFYPEQPYNSEVHLGKVFLKELRDQCGGNLAFSEGKLWAYGPTAWTEVPEDDLHRACQHLDKTPAGEKLKPLSLSSGAVRGILSEAKSYCSNPKFFDTYTEGMNVENGMVILGDDSSVELVSHDRNHRVRFTLDAEYDGMCDSLPEGSMLHTLLNGCFLGDDDAAEKINLIAEALGAAAFGMATKVKQPKAFIFLGESARNGKSTIADLFRALLPPGSVSRVSPGQMEDEKYSVGLLGAAANIADELSGSAVAGEAFKSAVTGDEMNGRALYKNVVRFRPRALNVFTTNVLPRFRGGIDGGLKRRLVVVQFNRQIPDDEIIPDIINIIREKEMQLLVSFAVYGAKRLKEQGGYTLPRSSSKRMNEWLLDDPVNDWADQRTSTASDTMPSGGWPKVSALYLSFKTWAEDEGYTSTALPSLSSFSQRVRGFDGVTVARASSGMIAKGIALKGQPGDVAF